LKYNYAILQMLNTDILPRVSDFATTYFSVQI